MQCIMKNIKTCELCLEQIIITEDFENLKFAKKQNLTILKNLMPNCRSKIRDEEEDANFTDNLRLLLKFIFQVLMGYVMENIKTCELCLGQIIKTEYPENLNCDEKQNLRILKELEITVSRDAKICSNCINVSHQTYNFKTSCLTNNDHLKTLMHPGINDKLILEEVIVKKSKSELKSEEKVCIFCLNFSDVNSLMEVNLEQDVILKDMLERCLPEIDINIVQKPLICYICSELLEKLFSFISQCKDTELLRNLDTKTDVLVNENTSTIKNYDENINKSFMKEENCVGIEKLELQIKSEDIDIDDDNKDSIYESNCLLEESEVPSSFPSSFTYHQTHWETRECTINELYKCTECLFQSKYQSSLVRHKKINEKGYKCNICGFTASTACENVRHKKKGHKDRKQGLGNSDEKEDVKPEPHGTIKEKKFVCDICSYQTTRNCHLKQHYLIHKAPSEVNLFKCDYCPFATKWKNNLIGHTMRHKNPSGMPNKELKQSVESNQNLKEVRQHNSVEKKEVDPEPQVTIKEKKFVCDICSYQTNRNDHLKQHYLIHKKPSEAKLFKCDFCPFATKWKNNLPLHTMRHKNLSVLPKFKCNNCPYKTDRRSHLVRHLLVHKDPSEVNMFKCKMCPFQTKYKKSILLHKRKMHQVEIYTCDKCTYKSKFKKCYMRHLQYHKEWKQPAKSRNLKKVRQYRCNECSYVGTRNWLLIKHQMLHKDPYEQQGR